MTTSTLSPDARRKTALFATGSLLSSTGVKQYFAKGKDGVSDVLRMENVPVFRSGTFRDSMGYQHDWMDMHMSQLVQNFDFLKTDILPDVPVRADHPSFLSGGSVRNIIGYHTALRVEKRTNSSDGKEYTYVLADYDIIDPTAADAINRGLWRNRSAEIGNYVTNGEAEFWPAYMGVAYVDIPAVEGLNGFMSKHQSTHFSMMTEEPVTGPAAPAQTTGQQEGQAPAAPTPANQPAAPAPQAFSIGGKATTDFAAVQAHITQLESSNAALSQFQTEQRQAGLEAFVKSLEDNKLILSTQKDATLAFGKIMLNAGTDQYNAWKATYEHAQPNPLLAQYAAGTQQNAGENGGAPVAPKTAEAEDLQTAKDIVLEHARANMPHDTIKKTGSYAKVIAAEPGYKIPA